jgi:hypothetical protein
MDMAHAAEVERHAQDFPEKHPYWNPGQSMSIIAFLSFRHFVSIF